MYEEGSLATTGIGVGVAGHFFGLSWIVGTGIAVILVGAALVRLGTRKRRYTGGRA